MIKLRKKELKIKHKRPFFDEELELIGENEDSPL